MKSKRAGKSAPVTVGAGTACEDILQVLNDYVDGALEPGVCAEFEKHLSGCNPCQVVVDNIRKTITLYKNGRPYELPKGFRDRLHDAVRRQWKKPSE